MASSTEGINHEVVAATTTSTASERDPALNGQAEDYHFEDALEQIAGGAESADADTKSSSKTLVEFSGESHGSVQLDSLAAHRLINSTISTERRPCTTTTAPAAAHQELQVVESGAIWEPREYDVISGRGAVVNAHTGNRTFRALCFARKALFEHANHAAKKRICAEIWSECVRNHGSRYLTREERKDPWLAQPTNMAELKAAQVMRDYKRPDRLLQRELVGKKRDRVSANPLDQVPVEPMPAHPLIECPDGVHPHDVLSGRGASVNGHPGNQRLRQLSAKRKNAFDRATFVNKRVLAEEIVGIIYSLNPPGRFLSKENPDKSWTEMTRDRAVHKACQVMRDMDRADRRDREERRCMRKMQRNAKMAEMVVAVTNGRDCSSHSSQLYLRPCSLDCNKT